MGIDPIMQKQRRLQKSQRVHYANLGNVYYNHLRCKRSTNREHFFKTTPGKLRDEESGAAHIVLMQFVGCCQKHKGQFSMRGENAAKGDFQISGST